MKEFTLRVIEVIENIPWGKVLTYGQVAELAGNPKAARQVSRILHSCSAKYNLPWHRVINSSGKISFKQKYAHDQQRSLLEKEGIKFSKSGTVDLDLYSGVDKLLFLLTGNS